MKNLDKQNGTSEFYGVNFDHHDFSNMCLMGATFENCNLRFCNFTDSDLSYSSFKNCDFYQSDFRKSCLYTSRFNSCDLTKADFSLALLSGVRISDTDVTHTEFGDKISVGRPRKQVSAVEKNSRILENKFRSKISSIASIEQNFDGHRCSTTNIEVAFLDDIDKSNWRVERRRSEVAKILQLLHEKNGYFGKALEYYYLYRRFDNMAEPKIVPKYLRYIFLDMVSGYGVKPSRPFAVWLFTPFIFLGLHLLLAYLGNPTVISFGSESLPLISQDGVRLLGLWKLLLCLLQVSCLSVFNDTVFTTLGLSLVVLQTMISLCLVGVLLASLTKRIALL